MNEIYHQLQFENMSDEDSVRMFGQLTLDVALMEGEQVDPDDDDIVGIQSPIV